MQLWLNLSVDRTGDLAVHQLTEQGQTAAGEISQRNIQRR